MRRNQLINLGIVIAAISLPFALPLASNAQNPPSSVHSTDDGLASHRRWTGIPGMRSARSRRTKN